MSTTFRFGSAVSFLAMASMIGGCATSQRTAGASSASAAAASKVGVATRAMLAISAGDFAKGVTFAEQAVTANPDDAILRTLLGNGYFGAGRFASAEAAFRDSLSLQSNQPRVILKLALAQIAQGKTAEAVAFLDAGRSVLDPADYGLALALAGRPADAIAALEPVARTVAADSRVRQNLALAHALSGDWTAARTVAAQDVPADQLDARLQQWMALARPAKAHDQVAALTGVTPAALDPGQPVQLALAKTDTRLALAPAPQPVVQAPQPAPVIAEASLPPLGTPTYAEPVAAPEPEPQPEPVRFAAAATIAPDAPSAFAAAVLAKRPAPEVRAKVAQRRVPVRKASFTPRAGKSNSVVQLGAYGSPQRVATAWDQAARRYSALRNYAPVSARFESDRGTVYRLSVKGFANGGEAAGLCASLRKAGASCFVRSVAGDAPVQLASR